MYPSRKNASSLARGHLTMKSSDEYLSHSFEPCLKFIIADAVWGLCATINRGPTHLLGRKIHREEEEKECQKKSRKFVLGLFSVAAPANTRCRSRQPRQ